MPGTPSSGFREILGGFSDVWPPDACDGKFADAFSRTLALRTRPASFAAMLRMVLAFALFLASVASLKAQTTWQGPAGGDWFTAGNWSNGLPDVNLGAVIDPGAVLVVSDTFLAGAQSLVLNGGTPTTPTFLASSKSILLISQDAVVGRDAGSHAFVFATTPHEFGILYFDFQVSGTLTLGQAGSGELRVTGSTRNHATALVLGSEGGSHGQLGISGSASLNTTAMARFADSGSATITISDAGKFNAADAGVQVGAEGGIASIAITGSHSQFLAGSLTVGSASTFTITSSGQLVAGGNATAGASEWTVNDGGLAQFTGSTLSTESSIWNLASGGRVTASTTLLDTPSELRFTLDASEASSGLWTSGALNFNGALTLLLANTYTPQAGDRFDLFDFTFHTGSFTTVSLPSLATGLSWDLSDLYTTGQISVIPEPAGGALVAFGFLSVVAASRKRLKR